MPDQTVQRLIPTLLHSDIETAHDVEAPFERARSLGDRRRVAPRAGRSVGEVAAIGHRIDV